MTTATRAIINIARDFSRYPAGRFNSDGPFSGEAFREKFLLPVISNGAEAVIEFDGTRGYASSFLEEAFGGLVRAGYSEDAVKNAFELESSDQSLIDEIFDYIENARDVHSKNNSQ